MPERAKDSVLATADRWLADFERAVAAADQAALGALFLPVALWRDLLAFTWHIGTVSGAEPIAAAILARAGTVRARGFKVDRARTAPRTVTRSGTETLEAIFRFETATGPGEGLLRLIPTEPGQGRPQAWTLMTALAEIADFPEAIGANRPTGNAYARDFRGPNWLDARLADQGYESRDPAVLVVGAGHAGLTVAARLRQLGVDTLVVDKEARVGDNWRLRYHALTLHNQVQVNHLPYMPFPPSWPSYIPKDKIAGWLEAYAESLELNIWTGCRLTGGRYDSAAGHWRVTLTRRDGGTREMQPRHLVMATSVSGVPKLPDIPSLDDFAGTRVHSSRYDSGADWAGHDALVLGTGNSGHDIAQDLEAHGARVTMIQRSPTLIVSVEPSAQLPYALYDEGPPLEDCDLIVAGTPMAVARRAHQLITARTKELDRELLDGLRRVGFKLDFGRDATGWQFKYQERGGGYYFNVGCSDLLVAGKVGLVQFDDIESFVAEGARLRGGALLPADLIVLATGYEGQDYLVRQLFGAEVAARVGPVWGFGPDGAELRNMWMRTGQPGLWFTGGSFAQCRIFSKVLALQIKACEAGLIPLQRGEGS